MILDARAIGSRTLPLRADICVVGAGAAGITIARHCAASGLMVLLVESGGLRSCKESQSLCRGSLAAGSNHPDPQLFRRRGVGGSTIIWGGRCAPFDSHDFGPRPWLAEDLAWPIAATDLAAFHAPAATLLDIGAPDFHARSAVPGGMQPIFAGFVDDDVSTETIERFSPPADLGRASEAELVASNRILTLLHATCTNIVLDEARDRVAAIDIRAQSGEAMQVRAQTFVLAAGGLEIPRLLLASNGQVAAGIGNAHDQVGRHYMSHIAGVTGLFTPAPGRTPFHGYQRDPDGVYCRRRFSIRASAQETSRIGNAIARLHHPALADPAHASGPLSALYLARRLLPREYARSLDSGCSQRRTLRHLLNIARDAPDTARFAAHLLRHRLLAARKFPSVIVTPPSGRYTLDIHAEQLPLRGSRITLADTRDCFGMPDLHVDWRCAPQDLRTVRTTVALIGKALQDNGCGALVADPERIDSDMRRAGAYGGHHLGGTRMSDTAGTGVVDANCRVHGIANLYIGGGAVFRTSSQANPTFTMVALALRLAAHLVGQPSSAVRAYAEDALV